MNQQEKKPRIHYKKPQEVEKIRQAGWVVSTVLAALRAAVAPGVTTLDLDRLAAEVIARHGGRASFLGHRHQEKVYHWSICASVNEEIVHGIPRGDRVLREGDLVKLDVGVKLGGYHADSATTVAVGAVSEEKQRLMAVTLESLWVGIRAMRPRGRLLDISRAVQGYVEGRGFSVAQGLSGHGIGRQLWEAPSVYNYVEENFEDPRLTEGLVLAIEPMVNAGTAEIEQLEDGWTVVSKDRKPSAHYEHTVAITRRGCEILTLGPHDHGR